MSFYNKKTLEYKIRANARFSGICFRIIPNRFGRSLKQSSLRSLNRIFNPINPNEFEVGMIRIENSARIDFD